MRHDRKGLKPKTALRGERGLVLVVSLGILIILALLGSSFLVRGLHENQLSDRSKATRGALFLAEASVDTAIDQLRVGNTGDVATTALGAGSYWGQVTDPAEDATLGMWDYRINASGKQGSEQHQLEVLAQRTPQSVFQFGLFGSQKVEVSGQAITDSYDSSLGAYDPATAGQKGNVGTNATTAGAVDISGTIAINGQIAVGEQAADPISVVDVSGSAIITGSPPIVAQTTNLQIPPDSPPVALSCTATLSVNGNQVVTLPADGGSACSVSTISTCCFKDLKVSGGGVLTTTGPVSLYVKHEFEAKGDAVLGVPSKPAQLLIVLLTPPNLATIEADFSGNAKFYGELYAPAGDIDIKGKAEVFGSIIAQDIKISGNAQVHYDEAMAKDPGRPVGSYAVTIKQWRDLQ